MNSKVEFEPLSNNPIKPKHREPAMSTKCRKWTYSIWILHLVLWSKTSSSLHQTSPQELTTQMVIQITTRKRENCEVFHGHISFLIFRLLSRLFSWTRSDNGPHYVKMLFLPGGHLSLNSYTEP